MKPQLAHPGAMNFLDGSNRLVPSFLGPVAKDPAPDVFPLAPQRLSQLAVVGVFPPRLGARRLAQAAEVSGRIAVLDSIAVALQASNRRAVVGAARRRPGLARPAQDPNQDPRHREDQQGRPTALPGSFQVFLVNLSGLGICFRCYGTAARTIVKQDGSPERSGRLSPWWAAES